MWYNFWHSNSYYFFPLCKKGFDNELPSFCLGFYDASVSVNNVNITWYLLRRPIETMKKSNQRRMEWHDIRLAYFKRFLLPLCSCNLNILKICFIASLKLAEPSRSLWCQRRFLADVGRKRKKKNETHLYIDRGCLFSDSDMTTNADPS